MPDSLRYRRYTPGFLHRRFAGAMYVVEMLDPWPASTISQYSLTQALAERLKDVEAVLDFDEGIYKLPTVAAGSFCPAAMTLLTRREALSPHHLNK